jgi:DNA-binding CsgD family transcriptional regulator
MLLRESGTGRELITRAVEESRQRAAIGTLPRLLFHLARDEAVTDRWAAASSEYHESIRLARETGQSTELAASLAGLGWLEARQGLQLACVAHLEESARLCDQHQIHLFRAWCHHGLGDLEAGQGSMVQALAHFDALATHLDRVGIHDADLNPAPERVELLLRLGRPDAARLAAVAFLEQATAKGQPWAMARAERSMAMCEPDELADERLTAAIGWHDRALDDYERAKTLLAFGSHLRRSRRRAEARAPLRQALAIFDALGAIPAAALAGVELRATGENPQPRGASTVVALTPQELQIATMLANGRTTRETAAALFLSPKTVEYHLRHVYAKLDVHSRDALARMLNSS